MAKVEKAMPLGGSKPFVIPQLSLQGGGYVNSSPTSSLKFNVENYKKLNIGSFSSYGTIAFYVDGVGIGVSPGKDVDISQYSILEIRWTYYATSQVQIVSANLNNVVFS